MLCTWQGFRPITYLSKSIWDGGDTNLETRVSQQREDYYAQDDGS